MRHQSGIASDGLRCTVTGLSAARPVQVLYSITTTLKAQCRVCAKLQGTLWDSP